MKFIIESQIIKAVMQRMAAVTESRTTIPILNNVKIEASDKVTFTATDLDIQIKESVSTQVTEQGSITAPAQTLKDVVSKLDDGPIVTFNLKDGILHVTSGKSKFKLNTLPADDFPVLATDQFQATLPFDGDHLARALKRTSWSAGKDETRYMLQGVALQSVNGKATLIACDGHRLAKFITNCEVNFPSIIIPTKAAKHVAAILDGHDDIVALHVSDTKFKLVCGPIEVLAKVVDATYVDWPRVIPAETNQSVTMESVDLIKSIGRVQPVMGSNSKIVKVSILDGELTIAVPPSHDGGEATDTIAAVKSGPDIEIGVSAKYALEAMSQADKGNVTIQYGGAGDPLRVTYDREPELLVVVMPARI